MISDLRYHDGGRYPRQASEQAGVPSAEVEGMTASDKRSAAKTSDYYPGDRGTSDRLDKLAATKITSPATAPNSRVLHRPLPTGVILLEQISHKYPTNQPGGRCGSG